MKTWWLGALVVAMVATTFPTVSDAKRVGAGKSSGMQRDMPARTAPDAPPAKPATPAQATPGATGAAAAGTAAAAGKRSWMGPLAGLAAGLGLAALMSHLGMGEGMANFLMFALLAVAAFFVIRLLMRRFGPQAAKPAGMQYSGNAGTPTQVAWPPASSGTPAPAIETAPEAVEATVAAETPATRTVARAFVPAAFDIESFTRVAKMIFIRLQAANDTRDLADLRSFTTPEMFAEIKLELQERGEGAQHTDVVRVDAEVLDVSEEAERQIVSVRFHGMVREEAGAEPTAFNEVWHLVKATSGNGSWAIAGIEQLA
jgi:predicted lipid-binding transport protein (Tim44 family)